MTRISFLSRVLLATGLCAGILFALSRLYYPFIADDALISFRYAERLAAGKGLTWNDGMRVEGYSNFLWTVSLAGARYLGMDLIHAARLLGFGFFFLLFFLWMDWGAAFRAKSLLPGLAASLTVATGSIAAVWVVGGLEQPLLAFLLGWSLLAMMPMLEGARSHGPQWLTGIPFALLCLTRPDGLLFVVVPAVMLLLMQRGSELMQLVGPSVFVTAAHYLGRYLYYGDWFPNTAYIKVRLCKERLLTGVDYLVAGIEGISPVLLFSVIGLAAAAAGHFRRSALAAAFVMLLWAAYIVVVGGDVFPGFRHLLPIQIAAAVLVLIGCDWVLFVSGKSRRTVSVVCLALAGIAACLQVTLQLRDPEFERAIDERWEWDGEVVGTLLGRGFSVPRPLLAVTAAGCIPYFSKLPALDLMGLNDRHIARRAPRVLAHDDGDGKYALDMKPDIILSHVYGGELMFVSGKEIQKDERLTEAYRMVTFDGYFPRTVRTRPFVRVDGRVGIRQENNAVVHPAYLLKGKGVVGMLGFGEKMVAKLPGGSTFETESLRLLSGTWKLRTTPSIPTVWATLKMPPMCEGAISISETDGTLVVSEPCEVQVLLRTGKLETAVEDVRFERQLISVPEDSIRKAGSGDILLQSGASGKGAPCSVIRTLGNFEGKKGWYGSDGAERWVTDHSEIGGQPVQGAIGGFVSSFDAKLGDGAVGVLIGPEFKVPENAMLSFRIGGGTMGVGLRAVMHGEVVRVWSSEVQSEKLQQIRVDLSLYEGQKMHLEIFDEAKEATGHVLIDDIVLERQSASCL